MSIKSRLAALEGGDSGIMGAWDTLGGIVHSLVDIDEQETRERISRMRDHNELDEFIGNALNMPDYRSKCKDSAVAVGMEIIIQKLPG